MTGVAHRRIADGCNGSIVGAVAPARPMPPGESLKIMVVFGTRPELIKMLPILREIDARPNFTAVTVSTSQHVDLVQQLTDVWPVKIDHDLDVMTHGQSLNDIVSRVIGRIDACLLQEMPDVVLVQGDTSSAFAASMASWHRHIPVGHVEAGLRTQDIGTPFPEEANRRLVSTLARFHFAPTARNASALLAEGVSPDQIHQTGNPIVDAVGMILGRQQPSPAVAQLVQSLAGKRTIVLTTHRRESFGPGLRDRLRVVRWFVEKNEDVSVVFPVHPNPNVKKVAYAELSGSERIHLTSPMVYPDFLYCLANAWAILSDSGGIQEEAPTLGKPLLILREETERPEAMQCGVARLIGLSPDRLEAELTELSRPGSWADNVSKTANPFGVGDSAKRILDVLEDWKAAERPDNPRMVAL